MEFANGLKSIENKFKGFRNNLKGLGNDLGNIFSKKKEDGPIEEVINEEN